MQPIVSVAVLLHKSPTKALASADCGLSYCHTKLWCRVKQQHLIDEAHVVQEKDSLFLLFVFSFSFHFLFFSADKGPYALMLSPTRELAQQIAAVMEEAGSSSNLKTLCAYGGVPKPPQVSPLPLTILT